MFKGISQPVFYGDLDLRCHCWWTSESPRAHVAKSYGRLRLIRSVWRASKLPVYKINWNGKFITIPFGFSLFWYLLVITLQLLNTTCLAKDHWRGFSTRNAHMVYIVNLIRLKWFIPLSRSLYLNYKLRRAKDTPNFISSGSKIVKRLQWRRCDPLIIERTIGLVLGPCTALYRPFLKYCTLTNKAVGEYITGLVQTSSEATRSWSSSPLIVSRNSFNHQTWARFLPGGA